MRGQPDNGMLITSRCGLISFWIGQYNAHMSQEISPPELKLQQEAERTKKIPYLFRGLSISKLKYSLSHDDGTPRPDTKRFFGQWSESLAQACSYAISPQFEDDHSAQNMMSPGALLIAKKDKIGDFSSWSPDRLGQKNLSYYREYDSNRNPKITDGQWLFIPKESLSGLDENALKEQDVSIATYSGEDVVWFETNLGMGTFFLISEVKKQMVLADAEFSPPITEILMPEDDEYMKVEFALFEAIKNYTKEEILIAQRKYQNIAAIAFEDADKVDRAAIKNKADQVKAKFDNAPSFSKIEELIGIAYFLPKE